MSWAPHVPKTPFSANEFAEQYKAQRQDALFHVLMAFVVALAVTLALYLVLALAYQASPLEACLGRVRDSDLPWPVAVLLSRSLLQPLNVVVFAFAAATLAIRLAMMPKEFRAFSHGYFNGIPASSDDGLTINEQFREVPLRNVEKIAQEYSGTLPLLVRRIEMGSRRLAEGGDAAETHEMMRALSEIDREVLENRFTLVRYLIWLIPTVGFLGTVVGIGSAIARFSTVMDQFGAATDNFQIRLQENLGQVSGQLGVAFDTTMLALLLSAFLVALTSVVQTREESLLLSIDEFCLRYFVSRISVSEAGTRSTAQVMAGLTSVAQGMQQLAAHVRENEHSEDISLRDIAGMIEGQTEQIRQAVRESPSGGSSSDSSA